MSLAERTKREALYRDLANLTNRAETLTRKKRDLITDLVLKASENALSFVVGNVATNSVSYVISRFNPDSEYNRLRALQSAYEDLN